MSQSDGLVVPTKSPNEAGLPAEEVVEGRSPAKGNMEEQTASRTQSRSGAPNALDRVREAARKDRKKKGADLLGRQKPDRFREVGFGASIRSERNRIASAV